ncbi:MAG: hypothetical protein IPH52_13170 [Leptospiraceae bacterium]|nr:hypothetical protein [Leptospiraceae bacterium]
MSIKPSQNKKSNPGIIRTNKVGFEVKCREICLVWKILPMQKSKEFQEEINSKKDARKDKDAFLSLRGQETKL